MQTSSLNLRTEQDRLEALRSLSLMDTPPDEGLDKLTGMVARHFDAPIALLTLVDDHRQWFKSKQGLSISATPREVAFCAYTVQASEPFIVLNAMKDWRFKENPLVTSAPHIRFYAGAPLITSSGFAIGSLCIIDTVERKWFRPQDRVLLQDASATAMKMIESLVRGR
jgi:GAF domain-containing protein